MPSWCPLRTGVLSWSKEQSGDDTKRSTGPGGGGCRLRGCDETIGGICVDRELWRLLAGYLLLVNLAGFLIMGLDKRRARRGQWRISEKALFLPAVLGGSLGSIAGMRTFRHKTKHWYFRYGLPALLIGQLALAAFLAWYFSK